MSRPPTEQVTIITDFSPGINRRPTKFTRIKPPQSESSDSLNSRYFRTGGITKAPGYAQKGDDVAGGVSNILGLGALNTSGGTDKLVAVKGTDHYVWNSGTDAWDAQSQTVTSGAKTEFESFLDYLFSVNRSDTTRSYSGSAWSSSTNVTGAPKANYIIEHNVRLYLADIVLPEVSLNQRSWLWFSDLPKNDLITWGFEAGTDLSTTASSAVITSASAAFKARNIKVGDKFTITTGSDIGEYVVASVDSATQITLTVNLTTTASNQTYWVGGNFLNYKTNNSDYIRGIGKNSEKILAFKYNSIGRTDGLNEIKEVKGVPGTLSHRSITNLREWTFYHHATGIWRYNGVTSQIISNPIWDYVEGIATANYDDIVGWTEKERYVKFAVGDVTNTERDIDRPDCVLVYDILDNQWSFESKSFTPTATTKFIESNAINQYIGADDGNVYQFDTGNSWAGSDIPFENSFGPIFPVSPEVEVDFTRILAFADPSLGVRLRYKLYYKDNNRIDTDWHEFIHNQESFGGNQRVELRFPEDARASGVEFLIEESGQTVSFLFERLAIFWKNAILA